MTGRTGVAARTLGGHEHKQVQDHLLWYPARRLSLPRLVHRIDCRGEVRLKPQCFRKLGDGSVQLPLNEVSIRQIDSRFDVRRLEVWLFGFRVYWFGLLVVEINTTTIRYP